MSKRILVVDDEDTLCEALRFNLEAEGYEVSIAHSAEEVLAMDISPYDLILLDIMMGDISTQLANILKSNPATASIPIILCTAKDTEDVVFCLLMWLGLSQVDAYITAYRPRANRNSIAAMASRKAKEDWAIEYINRLS